jgi:uncharacterized protein YjbJ (UPF0337 family)
MPDNISPTGTSSGAAGRADKLPDQEALKADADALLGKARDDLGKVASEASDQVSQLAEQAKSTVADATEKARGMATEQKDLLAAQIGGVADAMDRVAGDLESSNGASAQYARIIADNAEKLSDTIRDNDVEQILSMAQDFGRRQPVAFMGAAALLGFAASRFLLASARRSEPAADGLAATDDDSRTGYEPLDTSTSGTGASLGRP